MVRQIATRVWWIAVLALALAAVAVGAADTVPDSYLIEFQSAASEKVHASGAAALSTGAPSDPRQVMDQLVELHLGGTHRRLQRRGGSGANATDSVSHSYLSFGSVVWGAHLKLDNEKLALLNDTDAQDAVRAAFSSLLEALTCAANGTVDGTDSLAVQAQSTIAHLEPDLRMHVSNPLFRGRRLVRRSNDSATSAAAQLGASAVINFTTVTITNPPGWGLDRIDQRSLPLNNVYSYPNTSGIGVTAYIIDTGVQVSSPEFGGRATFGTNTYNGGSSTNTDDNGHGTFVASLVAGRYVGIARNASIVAIKSLGADGSGVASDVLDGLTWAVNNWISNGRRKAIINMSLGTSYSRAINSAVASAVQQGIAITVAAGNDNDDACNYSPSSESTVISVGATTFNDQLASFSNYGSCVSLLAPGDTVTGVVINASGSSAGASASTQGTVSPTPGVTYGTESGTSFSSPYVAGIIALMLSSLVADSPPSPAWIANAVVSLGVSGQITGLTGSRSGTPNVLTYSSFTTTGLATNSFAWRDALPALALQFALPAAAAAVALLSCWSHL